MTNRTNLNLTDKKFLIGHGDGLGPGDHRYKFMKKVFRNQVFSASFWDAASINRYWPCGLF